jgi:putative transposase
VTIAEQRALVQASAEGSVAVRCQAVGLARSSYYYRPRGETALNLQLMRLLDEEYTRHSFKGVLGMRDHLRLQGHQVNEKRVRRLLRLMGLEAVYPKPRLSVPGEGVTRYPYLLRERVITAPNEVWSTDITYIPMARGFLYLVAVLDWHSRYVLSWELSNTLDVGFCLTALRSALHHRPPRSSSTPIRAASSPAPPLSRRCWRPVARSVATAGGAPRTTLSLSGSGARSSGSASTSTRPRTGSTSISNCRPTSPTITTTAPIKP